MMLDRSLFEAASAGAQMSRKVFWFTKFTKRLSASSGFPFPAIVRGTQAFGKRGTCRRLIRRNSPGTRPRPSGTIFFCDDAGATLIEAAIVIGVILSFIAIIIDIGYIFLMQNAANRSAYTMIEEAKTDERFASETRTYPGWNYATSTSINDFRNARSAAITSGMTVLSTMTRAWNASDYPRRLRFRLSNFSGGSDFAEGALLFPGQSAVLETPEGDEVYRHIRIDKLNDAACQVANTPASCTCDEQSCPNLYSPGSSAWMAEARRNPPMAFVAVRVRPLLFLRLLRPFITVVGRAYSSPERVPTVKNMSPPGLTCGRLFPVEPGWEQYAGWGRWACEGVTCDQPPSGPQNVCMRAPNTTETTDGSNCSLCRPISCAEMFSHGGVAGWHWTTTFGSIRAYCRAQTGNPNAFGDLNNNLVMNPSGGWGSPLEAGCVDCRVPHSCLEAYGSASEMAACPAGQTRVENAGWWDARPAADITPEKCTTCSSTPAVQKCHEVNPPRPAGCPDGVFRPDNNYDPNAAGGGCWACQGTCDSHSVTAAQACGSCNVNENCGTYGNADFNGNASCCNRSFKPCSEWQGAGTCHDPVFVATLNAQGKDCKMVGSGGSCTGVGVCRNTCPAGRTPDANCHCTCVCPPGTYRLGDDPTTCQCVPASQGCTPAMSSCDNDHILVGTCCVKKN